MSRPTAEIARICGSRSRVVPGVWCNSMEQRATSSAATDLRGARIVRHSPIWAGRPARAMQMAEMAPEPPSGWRKGGWRASGFNPVQQTPTRHCALISAPAERASWDAVIQPAVSASLADRARPGIADQHCGARAMQRLQARR